MVYHSAGETGHNLSLASVAIAACGYFKTDKHPERVQWETNSGAPAEQQDVGMDLTQSGGEEGSGGAAESSAESRPAGIHSLRSQRATGQSPEVCRDERRGLRVQRATDIKRKRVWRQGKSSEGESGGPQQEDGHRHASSISGQARAEGKGELATGRHRADSGQETGKMYAAIVYIG
jgi:hypothetical protein